MQFSKAPTLRELAKLAGEDNEEMMDAIFAAESLQNEKALSRLRNYLMLKAKPQLDEPDPFHPYPTQEEFTGDLELGMTKDASCRIDRNLLCKNMFSAGIVGAGKTTHAFGLMKNLHEHGVRIMSLGVKRDVRHIACREMPMLVLRLCGNPNVSLGNIFEAPEGVDEMDYLTSVISCFALTTFIAEAGQSLLLETAITAKARHGYISLRTVMEELKRMKSWSRRGADWVATCQNRFGSFNTVFGRMINDEKPFPFEKVIEKHHMELELDGAGMYKSFFAAYPWLRILKYRLAKNLRGNKLLTSVFCDEVNMLASKTLERHAASLGSLPTLLEYAPLSREFGIGLISYSNQPSEVSNVLKAQAGIKMAMRLGSWADVLDMGNSMVLSNDQMKVIPDLSTGQAIIRLPGLNPFPIQIPDFPVIKSVTDEQVDFNNSQLLQGSEWERFIMPGKSGIASAVSINKKDEINDLERAFLFDVYNRVDVGLSERFRTLSLPLASGVRLADSLSSRMYIELHEINLVGRGGCTKFVELTNRAYDALKVSRKQGVGIGAGFLHGLVQKMLFGKFKGFGECKELAVEGRLQSKSIDVLVRLMDGRKIAIEVAMTHVNEYNNLVNDILSGCDYVIIVCKDHKVMKKVNEETMKANGIAKSRVIVCVIHQILKCKTVIEVLSLK